MTCIETEKECSAALVSILFDLCSGIIGSTLESYVHLVSVYIFLAMDLFCAETITFYAFLELVSQLSGTRHISILELAIKAI